MTDQSGKITSYLDAAFKDAHGRPGCQGTFEYQERENFPFKFDALPPEIVPRAIFACCPLCGAAYFAPGVFEQLSREKARSFLQAPGRLSAPALRFIRLHLGLTPRQLSSQLRMSIFAFRQAESASGLDEGKEKERLASLI